VTVSSQLKLSWSRIRLHTECPAKGHLTSQGRRSPVSDHRVFFPGTVTDRCMRQWLQLEVQERGWMAAQVDRIMDAEEEASQANGDGVVRWKTTTDRAEVRELCKAAVVQLEADLWTRLHLWEPPFHDWDPAPRFEVPISIPHPDGHKVEILLHGEIDLLVRRPLHPGEAQAGGTDENGMVVEVWDLKTTKDNQYWRKTLGQLVFYEIAVWGMTKGKWPARSGLLQPLCDETMPSWQFTADHRLEMFNRIVAVAGDILRGRLDPTPSTSKCQYCDVRHACPAKGGGRGRVQTFTVSRA
jgi:hypothetical protein